jgi:hypothetical protein
MPRIYGFDQVVVELYDYFDTHTQSLGLKTKLKQSGIVEEFIDTFGKLTLSIEGMSNTFFPECFISGLKDDIRAQVLMTFPQTWLEATQRAKEAQKFVLSQNNKPSFPRHPLSSTPPPHPTPLKIQKSTREEMVEHQLKCIFYNCDEKYFLGHKCKEKNFFMAISKDVVELDIDISHFAELPETTSITPPFDPIEIEPIISLNAHTGFFSPHTLKLIGYIKNLKVIIIIDSGSTHNFIHQCISQETHWYIHVVKNFQIMIANGGSMKCRGRCENVCLQIDQYNLKCYMFTIDIGGCDIVMGEEWLCTLDPILMDFK